MGRHTSADWAPRCTCTPSRGWKWRHSLWMIPALFGVCLLSWISFVYLAARVRRWSLIGLALAFIAAAVVAWSLTPPEGSAGDDVGLVVLIAWGAAIAMAFALNPMYLRWHWRHDGKCRCGADSRREWKPAQAQGAAADSHFADSAHSAPNAPMSQSMFLIQDVRPVARGPESHPLALPVAAAEPAVSPRPMSDEPSSPEEPPAGPSEEPPAGPSEEPPSGQSEESPSSPASAGSSSSASQERQRSASLGDAVVMSAVYQQHAAVVPVMFGNAQLASIINRMARARGARLSSHDMAVALGIPISRVHGGVSCLVRQLNVDGYQVVRREGDLTVLDLEVLREQFGV